MLLLYHPDPRVQGLSATVFEFAPASASLLMTGASWPAVCLAMGPYFGESEKSEGHFW